MLIDIENGGELFMHHSNKPNYGCRPSAVSPMAAPAVQPIVCPPLCRYTDSYIHREVPYIQPLINVNRQHIVDVPKTYYEEINETVVVPPGVGPQPNPFGGYGRR